MSSQEVAKKESGGLVSGTSNVLKSTTESVASAAASLSGAFAGSLHAGANASSRKVTTHTYGGEQMSKSEADRQYEERIEDEYAKREGGA